MQAETNEQVATIADRAEKAGESLATFEIHVREMKDALDPGPRRAEHVRWHSHSDI